MVTDTARQVTAFSGLRPFNPTRDLPGVALLLEEAFREDLGFMHFWSRVPFVRDVGAYVWAASFVPGMPDAMVGFVWEEQGRIIGNVTMTPDEGRRQQWLISNVAVETRYRRQGIARQMMLAAVEEARRRHARWVVLNVRPNNYGAIKLYAELGFEVADTEMGYALRSFSPSRAPAAALRRLAPSEYRLALDLARRSMGDRLQLLRPPRTSEYALNVEDRFAERVLDFFVGQSTERWGYFDGDALRATLSLHAQRVGTPHTFDIRVAPEARGELEAGIVSFMLARLSRFSRREIITKLLVSHGELVQALSREGFVPTRGLTLMAKPI